MKKTNKLSGMFTKERVTFLSVALVLCLGIVVSKLTSDNIPLHDGDVLVDSQNIEMEKEDKANSDKTGNFDLKTKRANLDLERNEMIGRYDETIKNTNNKAEQNNAIEQKEKLSGFMEQEIAVEGIIKNKDLPSSLVVITEKQINVTVDDKNLNQNTVAKICTIIMQETGRPASDIIIQGNKG